MKPHVAAPARKTVIENAYRWATFQAVTPSGLAETNDVHARNHASGHGGDHDTNRGQARIPCAGECAEIPRVAVGASSMGSAPA